MFFTSTGAGYGDVILAVNTLLMQLFTLFSYVMDGFAYAGEALTGKHIGARDTRLLLTTLRQLFRWGAWLAAGFTLVYGLGGELFWDCSANEEEVITGLRNYFTGPWPFLPQGLQPFCSTVSVSVPPLLPSC